MDKFEERTIKRQRLFQGQVIDVVLDDVLLPDGDEAKRELVFHSGAVAVLPITKTGEIILVKQFRKALEKSIWEIPAGKIDKSDDSALIAAKRELEEEIQMTGEFKYLGEFYTSPGFANEKIILYQATNLEEITQPRPRDVGEFLEVKAFKKDALPKISDAKTIIALQNLELKGVI